MSLCFNHINLWFTSNMATSTLRVAISIFPFYVLQLRDLNAWVVSSIDIDRIVTEHLVSTEKIVNPEGYVSTLTPRTKSPNSFANLISHWLNHVNYNIELSMPTKTQLQF